MRSSSGTDAPLGQQEYEVLRMTIARRGTARIVLVPASLSVWAALGLAQIAVAPLPLASLLSLTVLAAGFEAINALHVGVERIGRYLQVFYEETSADSSVGPRWETTAMAVAPGLPGGGVDPLFAVIYVIAVMLNLIVGLVPGPTAVEAGVVGGLHTLALVRIIRARLAAAKQRTVDLEHYRRIRDSRA